MHALCSTVLLKYSSHAYASLTCAYITSSMCLPVYTHSSVCLPSAEDIHHQQLTTNNFIKLDVHKCKYHDCTKSLYINVSHAGMCIGIATYSIAKFTDLVVTT